MSKYIGDVSAYAYAVSEGYTGTEEEFAELMADYANVGQRAEDAADRAEAALDEFTSVTADATTLPEGSSATAEYSDGHLTLGIPKGDKGDGAYHVEPSGESFVIHTDADGIVTSAQEIRISINAKQGTSAMVISSVTGLPNISLAGGGDIAPEILKNAFTGSVATIIYTIPANSQITAEQINAQYIARINNGTPNGYGISCSLSVAVVKDGAKGDKGDTGDKGDKGDKGDTGNTGNTPNLTIGTVTTLQPTAPATATITGTADNPVLSFGIPKGDTGEVSQDQFDAALALKADAIGNYPELAVGTAEQIDSDTVVSEDVAPYQFRQSISGASNRAYDKIVGVSLAVNQLINESRQYDATGGTISTSDNVGTFTASAGGQQVYKGYQSVSGHKYFASATAKATTANANIRLRVNANDSTDTFNSTNWKTICAIYSTPGTGGGSIGVIDRRESDWDTIYVKDFTVIDLTAIFGTTIADYVYSLETATAGAGVAWLKSHFPRIFNAGYVPYNAGELVSVQASAHKMVGFNQWDEEWEVGGINANTGENVTSTTMIRSKNFCKCLPSTQYCKTAPNTSLLNVFWYDADKQFISASGGGGNNPYTVVTSPDNAHYFKLRTDNGYGTTYGNNFCISLYGDGERNGEYEPYEEHSYPLDDSLELRGLPKLDADNNLVYDGDVYESTGKVARKYAAYVCTGQETLTTQQTLTNNKYMSFALPGAKNLSGVFSADFVTDMNVTYSDSINSDVAYGAFRRNTLFYISFPVSMTNADIQAWIAGKTIIYELATPTTESAQPFTNPQVVDASGTEEYVTDSVVPVGHVTKYVENLKAKLESAPASPAEDGDYIVRQTDGVNQYVPLNSAPAITAKADVSELLKAFPTDTASGAIASFTDGAELPLKSLAVAIEPIQDLHGYDNPWPAGGGVNKFGDYTIVNGYLNASGSIAAESDNRTYIVPIEPNTEYSIKIQRTSSSGSTNNDDAQIGEFYDESRPVAGSTGGTRLVTSGYVNNAINMTFTTGESAKWLAVKIGNVTKTNVEATAATVQLEKGSSVSSIYTPYSNICPISGHTQAVVTRTGKNLINPSSYAFTTKTQNGLTYTVQSDGSIEVSGTATATGGPTLIETMELPNGTYSWNNAGYSQNHVKCSYRKKDKTTGATSALANPFTVDGTYEIYINLYCDATGSYNLTLYPQIEAGSTVTTYESYSGTSLTIALGQTVYGGTLDVGTGVLTVDRAMVDLGSKTFTKWMNDNNAFACGVPGISTTNQNITCDTYAPLINGGTTWAAILSYDMTIYHPLNDVYLLIRDTRYTDATAFNTAMSGVQLVYPLATPITVTLTPNELSTLLGANNIWSDAGEVTAEYRADPTLFIQRKIAEALS